MGETENKISRLEMKTWGGWALTIFLSVMGAWMAMNARVYAIESEIAVLKARVVLLEKTDDRQQEISEKTVEIYNDIKVSLIRIEGVINTKQDKKWQP